MTASASLVLKRLFAEFGDRVAFATLYVREAHPGDRYPQPTSFERKLQHARDLQRRDRLPWPVAVDDLEGTLHRSLDPKPSAAYLMDAAGRVVLRALWANDESVVREGLEAVASGRPLPVGERQTKVVPLLSGMGMMDEVLQQAGREARSDLWREAPPLYALARLAGLFRPLPPLARGAAAVSVGLIGAAAVVGGVAWLLSGDRED